VRRWAVTLAGPERRVLRAPRFDAALAINPEKLEMHLRSPFNAALATLLSLSACMGSNDASSDSNDPAVAELAEPLAPATPSADGVNPDEAASPTPDTPVARICRDLMRRERDCSAVFLPALVAERVRLDNPAGIAAHDAQIGREALLSEALNEYTDDSKDERIAATCAHVSAKLPADRGQRLVSGGEACLRLDACEPFVACAVPISIQP
jgi:hypothetical protein